MSQFTKPLTVKKLKSGLWEVALGFAYYVGEKGSKDKIFVPTGFQTDFASVPRPFWIILPPDGHYTQAAVLHDFLYHKQDRKRKQCDLIFLEAMQVLGVSWWKRKVMYRAVRLFGWMPWRNKAYKREKSCSKKE